MHTHTKETKHNKMSVIEKNAIARDRLVLLRTRRVDDEPEAVTDAFNAIAQAVEALLRTLPNDSVDGGRVTAAADALIDARARLNEAAFYGRLRAAQKQ